jgi:hypothetical protein
MRRGCHPLLKGVKENNKYKHGFTAYEMDSLTSICEVVLPSLPMDIDAMKKLRKEDQHDDDDDDDVVSIKNVESFFNISASQYPIPHEVCIHWCFLVYVLFLFSIFFSLIQKKFLNARNFCNVQVGTTLKFSAAVLCIFLYFMQSIL